jgi:hypothetical protein
MRRAGGINDDEETVQRRLHVEFREGDRHNQRSFFDLRGAVGIS